MSSVLSEEENKAARLKQKLMHEGQSNNNEETRSFLNFSRGNLSISHSDLEHGFNKPRSLRPRRTTVLGTLALLVALLALALETWTLHAALANAREFDNLKRDVENLEHLIIEQGLLDELKVFEEQLYAEEANDDDNDDDDDDDDDGDGGDDDDGGAGAETDPDDDADDDDDGGMDIDNAEYDSYDDNSFWSEDEERHPPAGTYGARPSDFPDAPSILKPVPTPPDPKPNTELLEHLHALRKTEAKHGDKGPRDSHKERGGSHEGKKSTGHEAKAEKKEKKQKRSLPDRQGGPAAAYKRLSREEIKRTISRLRAHRSTEEQLADSNQTGLALLDKHPPKKYHAHAGAADAALNCSEQRVQRRKRPLDERFVEDALKTLIRCRAAASSAGRGKDGEITAPRRGMTKRHLRAPRQVYAVNYGAMPESPAAERHAAHHGDGVFKAWRASDWVSELGMNRHFSMGDDGRLTVHESGLYLAYAQIHYLDEHDENGFHLLVNGRPILQCMIYSPGVGHKSRSCFSAQVTLLHAGDVLVLKDVGSPRRALFHYDKTFFGLAKLAEARQQREATARHPATPQTA